MNKQGAYWSLTIHENSVCYNSIKSILDNMMINNPNIEFSYIKHKADLDDLKIHYHLVLYFKGKVTRFTTLQNLFVGAHIEQTNRQRYKRCIQYLIHKNNPEKTQYPQTDIVSNIETSELADILNSDGYDFELFCPDKLFDYFNEIYSSNGYVDMLSFINRFGIEAIKPYYFIIKDMTNDFLNLIHKVEFDNKHTDKLTKAFFKYHRNIKQEWQLAKYYGYFEGNCEEYQASLFDTFVHEVNEGLINIDNF